MHTLNTQLMLGCCWALGTRVEHWGLSETSFPGGSWRVTQEELRILASCLFEINFLAWPWYPHFSLVLILRCLKSQGVGVLYTHLRLGEDLCDFLSSLDFRTSATKSNIHLE